MRRLIAGLIGFLIMAGPTAAAGADGLQTIAAGFPATFVETDHTGPIFLFIAGSGPTDRDGNSPLGVTASYFAKLAGKLSKHGISSLRYDKRGVAGSAPVENEAEITLETYVDDAAAVVDWLRSHDQSRPILLLGHSEGGLIALEVARQRSDIDGIVLLATPGLPPAETLREQLQTLPEPLLSEAMVILADIEADRQTGDVPASLNGLFRPSVQPFLKSLFALRPANTLSSLDISSLVIGGGHDIQVGRADFDALAGAGPSVQSVWFEEMNHILADAPRDRHLNLATYSDPHIPLIRGLADAVSEFARPH